MLSRCISLWSQRDNSLCHKTKVVSNHERSGESHQTVLRSKRIKLILFSLQARAISPFLGPPSDYAVVKMIPNERLPPRNLHRVRVDKTQATLKWQPPYDTPNTPLVQHWLMLLWWWFMMKKMFHPNIWLVECRNICGCCSCETHTSKDC